MREGQREFSQHAAVCELVRRGLRAAPKQLPPQLFYNAEGSRLFELITELPEYYLTRAERSILEKHHRQIVTVVRARAHGKISVIELGAGTATKSQILVRELASVQGPTDFIVADVSGEALFEARDRIMREESNVHVIPWKSTHEQTLLDAQRLAEPRLVLFLGSSIGNYEKEHAIRLLSEVRRAIGITGVLILGTDSCKDPEILLPAYDDAREVTAAFNKNVLARINYELRGDFVLEQFRHVALWNANASRIEMHLESLVAQEVEIAACALRVSFRKGERIHTESSHKYDVSEIERMLRQAGLRLVSTFFDDEHRFGLHIAAPFGP